ncbi:replication initiation regulator SeqA [Gallaecimonas sp. GXIMD4217]|uniref:replication initiation regulator SeqA n=1 Tax=Gallaecimonas sp. GXIMD4217 TaxID=3131927 RepID=UPI00311B0739
MKTIEVDDDLYQYIASNTQHIGESASDILRRLLGFAQGAAAAPAVAKVNGEVPVETLENAGSAVGRFLAVLGELHGKHGQEFAKVLQIRGRDRLYFSTDAKALNAAGKSTNPKAIPGSPYWVVTNNNTAKKRAIVSQTMAVLGYDDGQIQDIVAKI